MKQLIIGLVGEIGSGKETFTRTLADVARGVRIEVVRSSDVLRETLALWNIPADRANLQLLAQRMELFGEGALSRAVAHRISRLATAADVVIFDGVRWDSDVLTVRGFERNLLVCVTAPIETRYARILQRKEKSGEERTTYEEFLRQSREPNELSIGRISAGADYVLENGGALAEFTRRVEDFASSVL